MGLVTFRLLVSLIALIVSSALASAAKNDASSFDKEAEKAITKLVKNLPDDAFFFDPIFLQTVDLANGGTKYTLPQGDAKTVFYARKSNDTGKGLIILKSAEDQLEFKKQKRVYIVLKKNKKGKSKVPEYHAAVAYVRNAAKKEKDAVKIQGTEYSIEFDLWDDHYMAGGTAMTLNSIFCSSSVILPCFFPDKPIEEGNGIVKAATPYTPKVVEKPSEGPSFVVDEGDPEDAFDLYRDLDNMKLVRQGRRMGRTYNYDDGNPGIIGSVANGVGGILCSVAGIFTGNSCNRRQHVDRKVEIDIEITKQINIPSSYPNPYGYTAGGAYPGVGYAAAPGYGVAPGFAVGGGAYVGYGRRKREAEEVKEVKAPTPAPGADYPGWKTQYVAVTKGVYLEPESIPYFGFGNCPVKRVTPEDLEKATTPEQLVDYYLAVLRTDCVEMLRAQILKLISMDVLTVEDKTLTVNVNKLKKATNPKFTLHETVYGQTAIETCAFTKTYVKLLKDNGPSPTTPDGANPISRTVNTATNLVLLVLGKSRELGRHHMISMTRHAITGARYVFSKLAQDQHNLEPCADCEEDKKLNLGDRLVSQALIQYLKYGLRKVDTQDKTDIMESFKTFYTKNKAAIEAKVNLYS